MAHSMGNVVAGEALKLASSQVVNTYVAMQGAVPAHCYDASTANRITPTPPDCYAHYWTNGAASYFNGTAGAGTYINFYNPNDWALNASHWQLDQNLKPDIGYGYDDFLNVFTRGTVFLTELNFPTNTYEIFSYAAPSWSYALGAQADVGGFSKETDLRGIWPSDNSTDDETKKYSVHKWHSAEFNFDNMQQANFWKTLLGSQGFNLK
jgi:hypothetical protein